MSNYYLEHTGAELDEAIERVLNAPSYVISDVSGASYGFTLKKVGFAEYYESTNQGVNSSAALCRVTFSVSTATTVRFDCINYAESNYDFGIFGLVDTALDTTYATDSSVAHSFKGSSSSEIQSVTYEIPTGTHFIDIKFRKDTSTSSNNDSLQFKLLLPKYERIIKK